MSRRFAITQKKKSIGWFVNVWTAHVLLEQFAAEVALRELNAWLKEAGAVTLVKFFWYMFFMFFTFLYFTFYGMTISFKIPIWWRWYSWACPVAYTLYGLVASQYGDITHVRLEDGEEEVKEFINRYFGFYHDSIGYVAAAVVGFAVLFSSAACRVLAIRHTTL